jgi:hypothetical protein
MRCGAFSHAPDLLDLPHAAADLAVVDGREGVALGATEAAGDEPPSN